jgi:hypothetical protein
MKKVFRKKITYVVICSLTLSILLAITCLTSYAQTSDLPKDGLKYHIYHMYSDKYLCTGNKNNGAKIHTWGPIPSKDYPKYCFIFEKTSDGYYYIKHEYSGKYLCTGNKNNGAKIHTWGPIPSGHENRYKFSLIHLKNGGFYIKHKYSGKYLCTGDRNNGAQIHTFGPIPSGDEELYKFGIHGITPPA